MRHQPERPAGRSTPGVPRTLRAAGVLTAAEGMVALVTSAVLVVRELGGAGDGVVSGYGIALWFAVIGAGVFAAGLALTRGRRGGRAPAVVVQLLLVPVAWSLLTDSGAPVVGAAVGVVLIGVLVLLFAPASSAWLAERFTVDHPPPDELDELDALSDRAARSRRGKSGSGR